MGINEHSNASQQRNQCRCHHMLHRMGRSKAEEKHQGNPDRRCHDPTQFEALAPPGRLALFEFADHCYAGIATA